MSTRKTPKPSGLLVRAPRNFSTACFPKAGANNSVFLLLDNLSVLGRANNFFHSGAGLGHDLVGLLQAAYELFVHFLRPLAHPFGELGGDRFIFARQIPSSVLDGHDGLAQAAHELFGLFRSRPLLKPFVESLGHFLHSSKALAGIFGHRSQFFGAQDERGNSKNNDDFRCTKTEKSHAYCPLSLQVRPQRAWSRVYEEAPSDRTPLAGYCFRRRNNEK
mmetsp:Transcript_53488/g.121950  ORF Transcript_53488/g.121950 Transcript_53488/m.121950 type:complete len:219 (-) Transcript_53488:135-791(-)